MSNKAVELAIKHINAMCNHNAAAQRDLLADDVHFTLITSVPGFPSPVQGNNAEEFMKAQGSPNPLVPGSLRLLKSIGDDHQALLVVTVKASMGPEPVTLLAARYYAIDQHDKIKNELVIISTYEGEV
jgi:hypothetical protein